MLGNCKGNVSGLDPNANMEAADQMSEGFNNKEKNVHKKLQGFLAEAQSLPVQKKI